jgi:hypothetical protein
MKLNWACSALFAVVSVIPSAAQISVYIGHPPPRVRYERRGPLPGPGYAWVNGYWSPQGGRINGCPAAGTARLIRARVGPAPAMNTTSKARSCVKVTGIVTSMVSAGITS